MGSMGTKFCQGCNNVCGDGRSMGESDLTNNNNAPIKNIYNPFLFNNQTDNLMHDPKKIIIYQKELTKEKIPKKRLYFYQQHLSK